MTKSATMNAYLIGDKQIEEIMTKLTNGSQNRIWRGPIRKGMSVINKEAKRRVPVLTGALKASIAVKVTTGRRRFVQGTRTGKTRAVVGMVGVRHNFESRGKIPNYYAHRVEKGWSYRSPSKGGKKNTRYRQSPGASTIDDKERKRRKRIRRTGASGSGAGQWFLSGAMRAARMRALSVIKGDMKRSLVKELRKLRARGKVSIGSRRGMVGI